MASPKNTSKKKSASVPKAPKKEPAAMPEKDPYFEHPHWLKVWHEKLLASPWARGLILAGILAGLALGVVNFVSKLEQPPSLAALLPEDATLAFMEFDRNQMDTMLKSVPSEFPWNATALTQHLTARLPSPEGPLPEWVGDRVGIAWILNEQGSVEEWVFLETDETPTAQLPDGASMESLREDPEYWKFQNESFFESDPGQEWLGRGYLVLGPEPMAIGLNSIVWDSMEGNEPTLKIDEAFSLLRPKLPYQAPLFGYVNTALVQNDGRMEPLLGTELLNWFTTIPSFKRDALKTLQAVFPIMGFTLEPEDGSETSLELHTVWQGDKTLNNGEALFHLTEKYKGDLLDRLPDSVTDFRAGLGLVTQAEQFIALLNALNGSGDLLRAYGLEQGAPYVGEAETVTSFLPIFNEELVWGVENGAPFLLLQLNDETQALFESFLAEVLAHGVVETDTESGVVSHATLTLATQDMGDTKVNALERDDGRLLWAYAIDAQNVLTLSTSAESLNELLNGPSSDQEVRFERAAAFGDHIQFMTLDPLVVGIHHLLSSFNLYDDGVATWHILSFE